MSKELLRLPSRLLARSRYKSSGRGYLGRYPKLIWQVVSIAWERGISVQSNYAREHADIIALAASLGWISTVSLDGKGYSREWNVTAEGTIALNHQQEP